MWHLSRSCRVGCLASVNVGSVSTPLAPLLDHPDDGGPDLTPAQCAAMLPRLEAIIDQRQHDGSDSILRRRIDDARQLVAVMRLCLDKDVELIFG
ncbi:hypothetical protein GCM10023191_007780 [Actinoallomurus oryzae]|uniref:Uncharacterized protein n=1 Tax=Actinoallomurus oryzae TaxID=502180 RepID=A0ABP8PAK0_9ACTN